MICGHRPDCSQFKIDPDLFCERIETIVEKAAEKRLIAELPKLQAMYEPKKKDPDKLSERMVQQKMFWWLNRKGHKYVVPNFTTFESGEMDLCSVLKSGVVHEYEIKISKQDFRRDCKKTKKREILTKIQANSKDRPLRSAPNHFVYVLPDKLVDPAEVPDFAGIVVFNPDPPVR